MSKQAIKASTQQHLDIHTIKDDTIILKDGSCAAVLQTTAINFALLSEEEQEAIMHAYAGLLNSLSFGIQILIRSQRKDISDYINFLDERISATASQKVKESVIRYRRFIKSMVKEKRVLEKHFYIVIPFSAAEMGLTVNSINPLAKRSDKPPFDTPYILDKATITLDPRCEHIIRQFGRIGLKTRRLTTPELISLFHHIYNEKTNTTLNLTNQNKLVDQMTTYNPQKANTPITQSIFSRGGNTPIK
jgi:type IV secretory pathway VirB4 component